MNLNFIVLVINLDLFNIVYIQASFFNYFRIWRRFSQHPYPYPRRLDIATQMLIFEGKDFNSKFMNQNAYTCTWLVLWFGKLFQLYKTQVCQPPSTSQSGLFTADSGQANNITRYLFSSEDQFTICCQHNEPKLDAVCQYLRSTKKQCTYKCFKSKRFHVKRV